MIISFTGNHSEGFLRKPGKHTKLISGFIWQWMPHMESWKRIFKGKWCKCKKKDKSEFKQWLLWRILCFLLEVSHYIKQKDISSASTRTAPCGREIIWRNPNVIEGRWEKESGDYFNGKHF